MFAKRASIRWRWLDASNGVRHTGLAYITGFFNSIRLYTPIPKPPIGNIAKRKLDESIEMFFKWIGFFLFFVKDFNSNTDIEINPIFCNETIFTNINFKHTIYLVKVSNTSEMIWIHKLECFEANAEALWCWRCWSWGRSFQTFTSIFRLITNFILLTNESSQWHR